MAMSCWEMTGIGCGGSSSDPLRRASGNKLANNRVGASSRRNDQLVIGRDPQNAMIVQKLIGHLGVDGMEKLRATCHGSSQWTASKLSVFDEDRFSAAQSPDQRARGNDHRRLPITEAGSLLVNQAEAHGMLQELRSNPGALEEGSGCGRMQGAGSNAGASAHAGGMTGRTSL